MSLFKNGPFLSYIQTILFRAPLRFVVVFRAGICNSAAERTKKGRPHLWSCLCHKPLWLSFCGSIFSSVKRKDWLVRTPAAQRQWLFDFLSSTGVGKMALYTLYFLRLALDSDANRYLRKDPQVYFFFCPFVQGWEKGCMVSRWVLGSAGDHL